MSSISVSSLVLGSLTVQVDGTDSTLALSVLATAPAVLSIELGTPGAQGDAATIAVGTTTTLSPGASATVVNAGTTSAAVFNFGIPAGAKGDTGNTGPTGAAATISVGSTSTGAAGSSASVVNSGTSSAAVFDFTIPRGDKGDKGDTGNTGATGSQGPAGTAATLDVGSTTTGAPGSSASVVNAGTTSAAVFNFTIPRGDVGATGATGATGPAGPGVAIGGTAGQSLLKVDGTDYNTTWGTPALSTASETTLATVRNATGSTLTAGQVVYINGALGNRPTVALSQANAEATSAGTYGMVSSPIANNADGTIVIAGYVANLDTSAYSDGDKLYLSPTVAGGYTTTKPSAPNHMVYVGVVTRSHPNQGVIQLRIQNGYELDELHNVSNTSLADKDLLAYESATSLWKNKSFSTLDLLTATTAASTYAATARGLPTGGTTGQVLSKIDGTNYNVQWATASGGGGGVDIQVFGGPTSSGTFTWTKPANAKMVYVWMVGGGGGGGSGARRATTSIRGGGGGGAGGNAYTRWINAAFLGATETVTVGLGGSGAVGATVNDTNGTSPASIANGYSSFANFRTYGPLGGGGGGSSTAGGAAGVSGNHVVEFGTIASPVGNAGLAGAIGANFNQANDYHAGLIANGGGGGAGQAANTAGSTTGGYGAGHGAYTGTTGPGLTSAVAGGLPGNYSPLTAAGNGVDGGFSSSFSGFRAGTGGGGGYYFANNPGGNGGNGGWPGGGGGGGGASDNGFTSGAGGKGANGIVVVITYS